MPDVRRWPVGLVFADETNRQTLTRAAAGGSLRRISAGVYTGELERPLADIVRRHLYNLLEHERPGIVITDASAMTGQPAEGHLFACSPRPQRHLRVPGLTVRIRRGPGPVDGDMVVGSQVWLAGPARGLLDNLSATRGSSDRVMNRADLERWAEQLLASRGPGYLNRLRDQARAIAQELGRRREAQLLDQMIGALLGTRDIGGLQDRSAVARAAGHPIDHARLETFQLLARWLADQAPNLLLDDPGLATRRLLLPFYEAYFSNFIEGTEFTLDEAADIALAGHLPQDRPQDAHDVLGTYHLVANHDEMSRLPRSVDELADLLRTRHRILLGGRTDMDPGQFKRRNNQAGATVFVNWDDVEGTLEAGLEPYQSVADPFARAVYMMFFISEVHPFLDGNGRVARIMMNAELVAAKQVRIIIPTVFRENYLSALRAATRTQHFDALYRTLDFARRYSARVDFSTRTAAEVDLTRTHALVDAIEAERNGIRLQLP